MATPTTAGTPRDLDPEEATKSLKVSLADLCAKATALYSQRQFEDAAEVYAQAAEMQAEMNGDLSPDNAEILFLYGRALFKVGQGKSDVLGGRAPEAKKPTKPKRAKHAKSADETGPATAEKKEGGAVEVAGSSAAAVAEAEAKLNKEEKEEPKSEQKKALFQFEGDENFVDSEEEDDDSEEGEGEEEDDLEAAFEILDLARVLFEKRLEALQAEDEGSQQQGNGKEAAVEGSTEDSGGNVSIIRHIKERLGDTHDLLAEISLENERYPNAITDSRAALKYKQDLYPFESEIIAEAHFKLSLALEFASVTKPSDDDDKPSSSTSGDVVDQSLRDEAATALESAINSTKAKLQTKEVELATLHNPDDNEATRKQIADVKEMLADMEQRLIDLKRPPVDLNAALGIAAPSRGGAGAGASGSGSAGEAMQVDEEVRKKATDLSGLVRKKRKAEGEETTKEEGGVEKKKAKEE